MVVEALLGGEQAWTPSFYLRSFDMDSVQVGKAVFVKESYTTLGIEPRKNVNSQNLKWSSSSGSNVEQVYPQLHLYSFFSRLRDAVSV